MKTYSSLYQTVSEQVPIERLLSFCGIQVPRSRYILCRVHNEKSPSCFIYGGDKGWYCFGCQVGGGSVEWLYHVDKLSKRDAVDWLVRVFKLSITKIQVRRPIKVTSNQLVLEWKRSIELKFWEFHNQIASPYVKKIVYDAWVDYSESLDRPFYIHTIHGRLPDLRYYSRRIWEFLLFILEMKLEQNEHI